MPDLIKVRPTKLVRTARLIDEGLSLNIRQTVLAGQQLDAGRASHEAGCGVGYGVV
jgi:hypothetical protein